MHYAPTTIAQAAATCWQIRCGKEVVVGTSQMTNLFFECRGFFECVARASGRQDQPWMFGEREETCFVYLAGLPCTLSAQRRVHKSDLVQSTYDLTLKPVAHYAPVSYCHPNNP